MFTLKKHQLLSSVRMQHSLTLDKAALTSTLIQLRRAYHPENGRSVLEVNHVAEFRELLMCWGDRHFQKFPWRKRLPLWKAVVVEIFLQRTRATQVAPLFKLFDKQYPTAESFASSDADKLRIMLAPLGLNWRIESLVRLSVEIGSRKGRLPRVQKQLEQLPGVGQYVAAAALSLNGFARATIIDSNVVRLLSRVKGEGFDAGSRRKAWIRQWSEQLTPEFEFKRFNYAILDLAMLVCGPKVPLCSKCPLNRLCLTGSKVVQ